VEMKWPAATSNYMTWMTSSLNIELENNAGKFIKGGTCWQLRVCEEIVQGNSFEGHARWSYGRLQFLLITTQDYH
jgi:hypothetical protein